MTSEGINFAEAVMENALERKKRFIAAFVISSELGISLTADDYAYIQDVFEF
jgi:hypothetical protein